jgi:hypothetical protein
MSQKSISDLNLNSITISNSNYSNISGYTAQYNTLQTNNTGELLVNGVPISSGGGGDTFNQIYIGVAPNPVVELICATDDVLVAGGETVATRPYVASNYLTLADADNDYLKITDAQAEYQTQADMANYSTTLEANAEYQTQADMANYSTTAQANALYQPVGSYQTQAAMANYSTTAQANALYQPIGAYITQTQANGLYVGLNRIGIGKIEFNTSIMIPGAVVQENLTIPNFNGDANTCCVISSNVVHYDGLAYTCNVEFVGNTGTSADFIALIANYSTVTGANNIRGFSVIAINP